MRGHEGIDRLLVEIGSIFEAAYPGRKQLSPDQAIYESPHGRELRQKFCYRREGLT